MEEDGGLTVDIILSSSSKAPGIWKVKGLVGCIVECEDSGVRGGVEGNSGSNQEAAEDDVDIEAGGSNSIEVDGL